MEHVKDFLYDISDLFFSLLIIALIFFVVAMKLDDTMSQTWFSNIKSDTSLSLDHIDASTPDSTTPVIDITPDPTTDVETPVEPETPIEVPVVEVRTVNFDIPSGSSGYQIASKLQAQGLIETTDEFLHVLAERDAERQLHAGSHKLNTGMTVEEIIKKFTGQ